MKIKFLCILGVFGLVACSGGNGSSNTGPTNTSESSGVFVDSPVGGIRYKTATLSGFTDDSGMFRCKSAETVSFYLEGDNGKQVALGQVKCQGVVSPIDLVTQGQFDITADIDKDLSVDQKSHLTKLLRLLQSLSVSDRPELVLTMSGAVISKFADHLESKGLSLATGIEQVISSDQFETKFVEAMAASGRPVVQEEVALANFEAYRTRCGSTQCVHQPGDSTVLSPAPTATPAPTVTPTPIPTPAAICIDGATYAPFLSPYYNGNYPIDTSTGLQIGNDSLALASTKIVLNPDYTADVYRIKRGSYYFKFVGAKWFADAKGNLTISSIGFQNGFVTLSIGPEINDGSFKFRYGSAASFGATLSEVDRMWRVQDSCNIPIAFSVVTPRF